MVTIHGGNFRMGIDAIEIPAFQRTFGIGDAKLFQDEIPKHDVTVHNFQLDKYLVTNADFKQFVYSVPKWRPGRVPPTLDNGNYLVHWKTPEVPIAKANHPVVNVNWYAAMAYCQWAGKRLPSEAEWQYAARGGVNALFPWGNEPADLTRVNYSGSHIGTTTPVGAYPANPYGLFDMAGNVWQFLADEWNSYPSTRPQPSVDVNHEAFLKVKTRRVIRGGSYDAVPVNLWVEYRDSHPANGSREFVGFRCAK